MQQWPGKMDAGISPGDAQEYCVRHETWQRLRIWLKTQDTEGKLNALWRWYTDGVIDIYERQRKVTLTETREWIRKLQVTNYLGALRRGGQLDMDNRLKKAR